MERENKVKFGILIQGFSIKRNLIFLYAKNTMSLKPYIDKQFSSNVANIIQTLLEPTGKLTDEKIGFYGLVYRMKSNYGTYIFGAGKTGNKKLIDFLMKKKFYNLILFRQNVLYGACEGGHLELVKELAEYYIKSWVNYIDSDGSSVLLNVLYHACKGGNFECVIYIISELGYCHIEGLKGACEGGNMEILEYLFKIYDCKNFQLCILLYYAGKGGNMKIVNFLIQKGANGWDSLLCGACAGGHMELVILALNKGAKDYYNALSVLCENEGDNVEIAEILIDYVDNLNGLINSACRYKNIKIVKLLLEYGAGADYAIINARFNGNQEIVDLLVEKSSWCCKLLCRSKKRKID